MESGANYKLVIFDLGNVIFRIDWEPMFQVWSHASGIRIEDLRNKFSFNDTYEKFERGQISEREFWEKTTNSSGMQISFEEFDQGWNSIYGDIFSETCSAISKLQGKISMVAFTNTNSLHVPTWTRLYQEVLSSFNKIYISSDMGCRKPEPDGFYWIMKDYDVSASEVIFFDDFEPNVKAAKALGIEAVLVNSPHVVMKFLSGIGLI